MMDNLIDSNMSAQKMMDIEDAVNMLTNIFHKILRVNLTDDTYSIITTYDWEKNQDKGYADSISSWMENFAYSGNVYEEDKSRYLEFVNIESLRSVFRLNKINQAIRYRRKVKDEFRWVEMELIPSKSYTDDNQIVFLYIRDIDEEYHRQTAIFQESIADALINFNNNSFCWMKYGQMVMSVDEGLSRIANSINKESERISFDKEFRKDVLLQHYKSGNQYIIKEITSKDLILDNQLSRLRVYIKFGKNNNTNDIEAKLFLKDITKDYINEELPRILYDREYISVGIIQAKSNILYIHKFDVGEQTDIFNGSSFCKFDEFVKEKMINEIGVNDREEFINNSNITHIVDMLRRQETYEINVNDVHGKSKRIRYQWFIKSDDVILCTVEDVSAMTEKDVLTGELNRRGFYSHVTDILDQNKELDDPDRYVILYFDIMNFKAVNELFGFEGGDRVLKKMPGLFRTSKLCPRIVARFSGDQFVCLININEFDVDVIKQMCEIVHEENGKKISMYQRCGIYYIDDDTIPVRVMCDHAKLALSRVENVAVKPFEIYEYKMGASYLDQSELITEVKRAFDNKEFCAYYQPIFDPKTDEIVSAEALVRWKHPTRGMISPGVFIPALEEMGMISSVDMFISNEVKAFLENRHREGKRIVPISVNLSRMDFYDTNIMDTIHRGLEDTSLNKDFFRYEVTESSYTTLTENNMASLDSIRKFGALILIDDFGSGYSSFGAITDYDFDIIKLDMEFVRKIGRNEKVASVIHALIDMIHHMGAKVVAEGAETKEQVDFLRRHDCDYIQGYYYSRPLPEDEFVRVLEN